MVDKIPEFGGDGFDGISDDRVDDGAGGELEGFLFGGLPVNLDLGLQIHFFVQVEDRLDLFLDEVLHRKLRVLRIEIFFKGSCHIVMSDTFDWPVRWPSSCDVHNYFRL